MSSLDVEAPTMVTMEPLRVLSVRLAPGPVWQQGTLINVRVHVTLNKACGKMSNSTLSSWEF